MNRALELDAKQPKVLDLRGRILSAQGKHAEAISDFYAATKLSIGFADAYYHRAQAYEAQGDAGFAREDYKQACKLGHKPSCEAAKKTQTPKSGGKAEKGKTADFKGTAPSGEEIEAQDESKPRKAAAAKAAAVDLAACRSNIEDCSEQGMAITFCVKRSRVCEKDPQAGCCPQKCLREFEVGASDDKSDAEVFREIFSVKGRCAKIIRGPAPAASRP